MAKQKRKKSRKGSARLVTGAALMVLALLILVALITHAAVDDARLRGDIDEHLNPLTDIQYRNQAGTVGAFLSFVLVFFMGWLSFFVPLSIAITSLRLLSSELIASVRPRSFILFICAFVATMLYDIHLLVTRTVASAIEAPGGYLTEKITGLSLAVFGQVGSYIVLSGILIAILLAFTPIASLLSVRFASIPRFTYRTPLQKLLAVPRGIWSFIARLRNRSIDDPSVIPGSMTNEREPNPDQDGRSIEAERRERAKKEEHVPTGSRKSVLKKKAEPIKIKSLKYDYPSLDFLELGGTGAAAITNDEMTFTARMLKETLETFDVLVDGSITCHPGPVITRYEFKPAAGIKVNRILSLSDDLALSLKAKRIRIIAPIPGKGAVGIEIPNPSPQTVYVRDILQSDAYMNPSYMLPLALGKTTSGEPYVADLAKMPHLLIAGATGSGKSICMNILITSLLYRLHPLHVRFIFIDPKLLELSVYSGIPHLARPVVTKPKRAEKVLAESVVEMEKRYRKLAMVGVRNIEDYNSRQKDEEDKLPYIVIFVDELADLMMSSTSTKTELLITRLAQMARAVGIHLVLATQRPSVDVITGLIKANFPARIAFQVSSKVDSRTILDANGAEGLLGRGDMLFMSSGQPDPVRIHGAFVTSDETEKIVDSIKEQDIPMQTLENISQASGEPTETEVDTGDPLFKEACEVVIRHKQGSVSLLQRRLGIGYQRAARLIDKLEGAGVVSTFDGSKARDVLVDQSYLDRVFGITAEQPTESN